MNFASTREDGANSMVELARQASNANLSIDLPTKALSENTACYCNWYRACTL